MHSAAAGAAAGVLLGANMVRGQQCDAACVSASDCCHDGEVYTPDTPGLSAADNGGAISMTGGNLEVYDTTFSDNTGHRGGAIYWEAGSAAAGYTCKIVRATFRGNKARDALEANRDSKAGSGGAIYMKGDSDQSCAGADCGVLELTDSVFDNNVAWSKNINLNRGEWVYGGAVSVVNAHLLAAGCVFSRNGVSYQGSDYAYGGAVAIQVRAAGYKASFKECSFNHNDGKFGTAIYNGDGKDIAPDVFPLGATVAVALSNFTANGQGGVMTPFGFDVYGGDLHTIYSGSSVRYIASRGLEDSDIHISSRSKTYRSC